MYHYHSDRRYVTITLIQRICTYHVSFVYRETIVHTHLAVQRCGCTRILRNGIDIVLYSLFHISYSSTVFFFFLFDFLFLKIAAHCCDVVCLQSRELLLRCQWLHSSLAPCHFMLQSPSPPPPPLFHPFAYDTSRRAVMPSRATPPERENERFPREKRVVVKSKRFPLLYTVGGWAHGCPV